MGKATKDDAAPRRTVLPLCCDYAESNPALSADHRRASLAVELAIEAVMVTEPTELHYGAKLSGATQQYRDRLNALYLVKDSLEEIALHAAGLPATFGADLDVRR